MTARLLLSRRRLVAGLGLGLVAAPAVAFAEGGAEHAPAPVRRVRPKAKAPAPAATAPGIEVASGQRPFATILACADSRVAPEVIFDQGLGDLFVVRVAGNVVDDAVLASIEYSVIHLGSTLIMALGHERCGAVKATADALAGRGDPADSETRIGALASLIAPAVRAVPAGTVDAVDAAVSLNAAHAASEIAESCHEPSIRASFLALAEHWLARAGEAEWLGGERVRATA